jgi:hypothetical protein
MRTLAQYAFGLAAFLFCLDEAFAIDLAAAVGHSAPPPTTAANAPLDPNCGALPTAQCDPTIARGRATGWPQVWGYIDTAWIFVGERMAQNGVLFEPLFVTSINLNIGLLPNKKLSCSRTADSGRRSPASASPIRGRAILISANVNSTSMRASHGIISIVWSCGHPPILRAISIAVFR